jgi:uncharacterized protein
MAPADPGPEAAAPLRIDVVACLGPRHWLARQLELPAGATVADAVKAAGWPLPEDASMLGVWGRRQPLDAPLRDRDRVELYRPLQVDPKEARRQRYRGQKPPRRLRAA